MDSNQKDQALEQSAQEQPNVTQEDQALEQSHTFEVNWQKLTWEQLLTNYKSLQAEFTRKTQELSKAKKESELSEEDKKAIEFLRQNDFLTREDLEGYAAKKVQETKLSQLVANDPELQPFESAIKKLSESEGIAPEDVIVKYGFKSNNKLSKAKSQGDVKWWPAPKAKSINEMSLDEYEKWRKEKWIWTKGTFS